MKSKYQGTKKESKKFIKFQYCCQWLCNGYCTATPEKSDCFEKKCALFKSKYIKSYFGITRFLFDSDEELEFYCWLEEGEARGLIKKIRFHKINFQLSEKATIPFKKRMKTKVKLIDKFILHPHVYSPDFDFEITSEKLLKLNFFIENNRNGNFMLVDVKGGFSKSVDRFSINQKWTFAKYGLYVQKIIPEVLFKKTWVPEVCRLSPKQLKPVKKYVGVKTINEFMEV